MKGCPVETAVDCPCRFFRAVVYAFVIHKNSHPEKILMDAVRLAVKGRKRGEESYRMYDVVADHRHFILIDKCPGVGFHKEKGTRGLIEALRSDLNRDVLYPVHRLDKMTSGLLLVGKSKAVARDLAGQFYAGAVEKYYIALSDTRPRKKQGLIAGDMARTRRGMWKLLRSKTDPAITQFFSRSFAGNLRLFVLRPRTGKTHQLRVALKSIGSPVLGDPRYYTTSTGRHDVDRGYLHAYALAFTLEGETFRFVRNPSTGIYFTGDSFTRTMEAFKNPWELPWPVMPVR